MRHKQIIIFIIFILAFLGSTCGQNVDVFKEDNKKTYEYYIEGKKVSEDEFVKNNKTGTEKEFRNGILRYESELKEGRGHGKNIEYFENGHVKRIIDFKNGKINGPFIEWYKNGQIATLAYWDYRDSENSIRQVNWDEEGNLIEDSEYNHTYWNYRKWHKNGMLVEESKERNGEQYKYTQYYENGQKKQEGYLIEGINKYIDIKYYENGQIKSQGERERESRRKEGTWVIWERDGSIKCIQTWKDGRRVNPPLLYYFPKELFYDETKRDIDIFWLEVYSEYLSALEEPVLYNSKTEKEIYRFTLLRAFDDPVSIRIEKEDDKIYLYAKMADLDYELSDVIEPGILIMSAKKEIKKEYWEGFLNLLEKINYWKMEAKEKDEIPKNEEGAIETVLIKTDGSHWILEGLKKGQYHFVDRWSPDEKSEFRKCCEYLLELSDLKIKEKY